jgi:hypothetical protein
MPSRNFTCPATDCPCAEEQCNYKATGYCLRGEREDFAARCAQEDEAKLDEAKRLRDHRKELRIERERKRRWILSF